MKNATAVITILAIVFGVAGAGTMIFAMRWVATAEQPAIIPMSEDEPEPELMSAIREMRTEIRELHDRLKALESRPAQTEGSLQNVKDHSLKSKPFDEQSFKEEALEELKEEMRSRMETLEARRNEPTQFKAKVAEAVTSIRKEEAVNYFRKAQEKKSERLEDRLIHLSEELNLDHNQVTAMRSILTTQYDRGLEVILLWEEGAADELIGETKHANLTEFQQALEQTLTQEQLAAFRELQEENSKNGK